jgi:hypothetical protein
MKTQKKPLKRRIMAKDGEVRLERYKTRLMMYKTRLGVYKVRLGLYIGGENGFHS